MCSSQSEFGSDQYLHLCQFKKKLNHPNTTYFIKGIYACSIVHQNRHHIILVRSESYRWNFSRFIFFYFFKWNINSCVIIANFFEEVFGIPLTSNITLNGFFSLVTLTGLLRFDRSFVAWKRCNVFEAIDSEIDCQSGCGSHWLKITTRVKLRILSLYLIIIRTDMSSVSLKRIFFMRNSKKYNAFLTFIRYCFKTKEWCVCCGTSTF